MSAETVYASRRAGVRAHELASKHWPAIGTTAHVVVTSPVALDAATAIVAGELDELDRACSRFRPDSEIATLAGAGGAWVTVSDVLTEVLAGALDVARSTDGDVDPTMGADLHRLGYDRDFGELVEISQSVSANTPLTYRITRRTTWHDVELDVANSRVRVPAGVVIDLGAVAKAWCADRCARRVATEIGVGVLISLGGDIATAGIGPLAGWVVRVQDKPDSAGGPSCAVVLHDGYAVATSSTLTRSWLRGASRLHHILDPATRLPADPVWRTVTVAAASCVRANAASTASIVRGRHAPQWLAGLGMAARFVDVDGVVSNVGSWPQDVAR
jgi:thiamine biosynthesis lipoprotein